MRGGVRTERSGPGAGFEDVRVSREVRVCTHLGGEHFEGALLGSHGVQEVDLQTPVFSRRQLHLGCELRRGNQTDPGTVVML